MNGLGELFFEIQADEATGVIDMHRRAERGADGSLPDRVVALPGGGSAYTFTMFQAPEQPDEQFEGQYASLVRELENIRRELS